VRLWPRNGYYWSSRYPRMVEPRCATGPTPSSWMAKPCCSASTASPTFNALHSCKHDDEVQLYTFDVMMSAGDDLRPLPLHLRKHYLAKTLRRRVDGIILNEFEQGEIGPELFRHACLMRLEGIVSKHKDQPYRAGRSKHWIKVKNRTSPAMNRPEGML
jgi:bifunctional non-homologous end joining protein LigD